METATTRKPLHVTQVHLSQNAGRILLGCIETLRTDGNKEEIASKTLIAVRDQIEGVFNLRPTGTDKIPLSSAVFRLTRIAYDLLVNIVRLAKETEPDGLDNDLRDTVLKTLQDANPPGKNNQSSEGLKEKLARTSEEIRQLAAKISEPDTSESGEEKTATPNNTGETR